MLVVPGLEVKFRMKVARGTAVVLAIANPL